MQPSAAPQATAVADDSFDWNNAAEQSIASILGLVPEVGPLLSTLVFIFWPPSQQDVWAEIEAQVEQLIQQDLSQLVEAQVDASLQGLNNNLSSYLTALKVGTGDPSYISEKWNVANGDFLQQLPTFQLTGYQVLLLPLFAQFANMHLSLLRDGVVGGSNWGWTPEIVADTQTQLTNAITAYTTYAQSTYKSGLGSVQKSTKANNHACQPFRTVNAYVRQMTLTALDFVYMWPYFDVSKYPNGMTVINPREIYSDPQGTCDNSGNIVLPAPATRPINQITVWGWDRIDAVQLKYPSGAGPGGVTTTARMGDKSGGSAAPPHGGVFQVANNPVTVASGISGDIVNGMSFTFANGSSTGLLGGNYPGGGAINWSYPGEILSSIHINGVSSFYGSADCVVFGFKFQSPQPANNNLQRMLYVTTPVVPASLASAGDPDARAAYWSYLAARTSAA